MKKICNQAAFERKITVYFEERSVKQTSIYPPNNLKKMIEEHAEDNMESVSRAVCKICKAFFKQNPPRIKSNIKD